MRRSGQLAAVTLLSMLGSACHKKTLLPPAPTAQTPAPRAHTTTPPPAPPTPPEPAPPQQPPEFKLGQSVSPEESRANNALIDRHLQQAAHTLGLVERRTLTAEQRTSVKQIRGFMDQAREMRTTDVIRARSLAERADVLAQDLLSRLR